MKQLFIISCLFLVILPACKKKDSNTPDNPTTKISPMDKLPDASTGWNIAPCKLIDEDYLRKLLKIENVAIALIPNVAQNNQGVSSCAYRWMKSDFQTIQENNTKLQAIADKKKTTFIPQATLNTIVISYTGKYADATAATAALDATMKDATLGKQTAIAAIGDKAIWHQETNQLTVQKGSYVFYVQVNLDPKKNLDSAKQFAIATCKLL
jgi:hypothetical protein